MNRLRIRSRRPGRVLAALVLIALSALASARTSGSLLPAASIQGVAHAAGACTLGTAAGPVQHVIYIQFDNTHFSRDNPNVPSDLEQMPHLLSFFKNNGVVLSNHHTPLISHTSEDILTALTGVYPSHHGVAIGQNSYHFYANGSPTLVHDRLHVLDRYHRQRHLQHAQRPPTAAKPTGTNAPAPWVPYTRAGCDVGAVASANQVLENANVNSKFGANDIGTVYGVNSPEAQETTAQRTTDFVGIGVHCSAAR